MYDTTTGIIIFIFGLFALFVAMMIYYHIKNDVIKEEKKRQAEEKKVRKVAPVPTESAPTPAEPKKQSAEDDREAIKREILEELRSQGLKPARRRFTARQKGAIALFLLQTASYAGSLVQVGVGAISALAYSIGASVFMVIGAILLLTEKKEGN